MIEMTLSSRHRIRNSSPGGLRPSTLPLGHGGSPQYWLSHVDGEETFFVSFKTPRQGTEPRTLAWKAAVLTTTLGPLPKIRKQEFRLYIYRYWQMRSTKIKKKLLQFYMDMFTSCMVILRSQNKITDFF